MKIAKNAYTVPGSSCVAGTVKYSHVTEIIGILAHFLNPVIHSNTLIEYLCCARHRREIKPEALM